jgi:hypothetical protein
VQDKHVVEVWLVLVWNVALAHAVHAPADDPGPRQQGHTVPSMPMAAGAEPLDEPFMDTHSRRLW